MVFIQKQFKERHDALASKLNQADLTLPVLNDLFPEFNELRDYISGLGYSLTSFDRQSYKEQLEKLEKRMGEVKAKLEPPKKFAFSKKTRKDETKTPESCEDTTLKSSSTPQNGAGFGSLISGIENKENETIRFDQKQLTPTFKLVNLKNCEIFLDGALGVLYFKDLENCRINTGVVRGSIFIDGVKDCQLQLIAQQIRIHNSVNTTFLTYVTSDIIIEHCDKLVFGKYNYYYPNLQQDLIGSSFQEKQNNWKIVKDFNWLKAEASPNFNIIETQS